MTGRKVSEFGEKKEAARLLRQKELKLVRLTQEVKSLRRQVRSKDRTIVSFKRELSSMVHIGPSKELEQAVKVGEEGVRVGAVWEGKDRDHRGDKLALKPLLLRVVGGTTALA